MELVRWMDTLLNVSYFHFTQFVTYLRINLSLLLMSFMKLFLGEIQIFLKNKNYNCMKTKFSVKILASIKYEVST